MKILLLNVHSALNLGDEAIMAVTVSSLQQAFPQVHITIAANDPQSWQDYTSPTVSILPSLSNWVADARLGQWRQSLIKTPFYLFWLTGVVILWRLLAWRWPFGRPEQGQLLEAYYQADLVLSCGGGNFYAHHSPSPAFFWNLMTLALARGLGKPVLMLPQSFGPVRGRGQQLLARLVLNRVNLIMCREAISVQFLQKTLRLRTPMRLLPDLAFGLGQSSTNADKPQGMDEQSVNRPGARMRLGLSVLNRGAQNREFQGQNQYEEALVTVLTHFAQVEQAEIHLFVQCYGPSSDQDDRLMTKRLAERLRPHCPALFVWEHFRDAQTLKTAYRQMDGVIATRMHTAIFALSNETPVLIIGYQPKSQGMITAFHLEAYCRPIEAVTAAWLQERLTTLLAERETIGTQIQHHLIMLQAQNSYWLREVKDNIK